MSLILRPDQIDVKRGGNLFVIITLKMAFKHVFGLVAESLGVFNGHVAGHQAMPAGALNCQAR